MVLAMLLLVSAGVSQARKPPTRTTFVFYVYVDPIHGDNTRAFAANPRSAVIPGQLPLDYHPEPASPPTSWPIGGLLQHAPFHFKTLTGTNGALAWIDSLLLAGNQVLPWTNPAGGRSVDWIVVHCLPGLYGPLGDGLPDVDPVSGLRFNGEVWPARIRTRVSLQGTSALDTIFDARGRVTAILNVNDGLGGGAFSHDETFIDSLSLRGARSPTTPPPPSSVPDGAGAAIHVWCDDRIANRSLQNHVTISNCFIYDNVVGIAINSWVSSGTAAQVHAPAIVNNTIAWNATGLWCGTSPQGGLSSNSGAFLINNVIDSGSPPGFIAGISGFEGVTQNNLVVTSIAGLVALPGQDFNAWEYSTTPGTYVNRNVAIAPNWPATTFFPSATLPPRVQIQAYTQPSRPGALYVNDILRRAPPQAVPAGYDYSRHDFRLAPCVTTTASPPTAAQTNPLVNQGLDLANLALYPIANSYRSLTSAPGLPPGAESCPVHAYDWDAEGFGNPRVQARSGFAAGVILWPGLSPIATTLDLGADEMGNLIMAGHVPSTRMFHYHQDGLGNFVDQTMVLYFDIVGTSRPRPWCNLLWGGRHEPASIPANAYAWFQHKFSTTADADQGNFTTIPFPFFNTFPPLFWEPVRHMYMDAVWLQPGFTPFVPHMRSLECDFGGCLLPDLNPRWAQLVNMPTLPYSLRDEYGSNPWWGHAQPPQTLSVPSPTCRDNPTLYHNIGADAHDPAIYGLTTTEVFDATMCPPGAGMFFGTVYLDLTYTNLLFGPWSPCSGGSNYLTGPWGYGDAAPSCPERIPYFSQVDSLGVRWNCQTSELSNLQTFLSVVAGINPGFAGSMLTRKASAMPSERKPSTAEIQSFPSRLQRPGGKP